jgi:threonine/homoserine efflux transporter RhtA
VKEERLVEPDYYQLVITSTIEPLLFVSANSSLPPIKQDINALAMFTAVRFALLCSCQGDTVRAVVGRVVLTQKLRDSCFSILTLLKRSFSVPRSLTSRYAGVRVTDRSVYTKPT